MGFCEGMPYCLNIIIESSYDSMQIWMNALLITCVMIMLCVITLLEALAVNVCQDSQEMVFIAVSTLTYKYVLALNRQR